MRKLSARAFRILVTVGIGVVVLVLIAYLALKSVKLNRENCEDVLQTFAVSLMQNKAEVAKSLTSPEEWDRIDVWMAEHAEVHCSFSLDPDDTQGYSICNSCSAGEAASMCCEFGFSCAYGDGIYRLSIDDVRLKKHGEECQVVMWGKVCESGRGESTDKCD